MIRFSRIFLDKGRILFVVTKHARYCIVILCILLSLITLAGVPNTFVYATSSIVGIDTGSGSEGLQNSTKLNSSGFAVTAYYANSYSALRLAVCNDTSCSAPNIVTLDNAGGYPSLAFNSSGNPVISYYSSAGLKLAVCGNATCSTGNTLTTVSGISSVTQASPLVFDSSGNPIVAIYEASKLKLLVCGNSTCTSGNTITIIGNASSSGTISLVLNSSGNPLISYYSGSSLDLMYCANLICNSIDNIKTTVDNSANVGQYSSMVLNSSGNPVISYYNVASQDLKVVVCGNVVCTGTTTITTVDSTGNVGQYPSLSLNSSGNPVVSYSNGLKLVVCGNATCSSGNTITTVDSTAGSYSSLVLAASGNPVISHNNPTKKSLSLALCSNATCSTKTIKDLDVLHDVGRDTSLVLTNAGIPIISYSDSTNGDLKVAICGNETCSSGNTITTVDSASAVGYYTSIALRNGNPVISYYASTAGDLKIAVCGNATCTSGNTITVLDSTGDVGRNTSLALDNNGNPVISYYDFTNGDLKLAVCGNTTCTTGNTIATVDSSGNSGQHSSLKLTNSGVPVISYYEAVGGDLKLAVCGNATCTSGNTITGVDTVWDVGNYGTSLVINSNGNPSISYSDLTNNRLKMVQCGNSTCTSGNTFAIIETGVSTSSYPSMVLNSAGNPVISYYAFGVSDLKLALCGNAACSSGNVLTTLDSNGTVGTFSSLKLRADGAAFVSYYDSTNYDLKLYSDVPGATPTPTTTPTNTPVPPRPDTIGVYNNGTFYLRNSNNTGSADLNPTFGSTSNSPLPVAGDWNGDGVDTIGVYYSATGVFSLSNSNTSPTENYSLTFGDPGDTPFAGRWTSDMTHDGVGVYRNSNGILYQKKDLTTGFSDYYAVFGNAGDRGIGGDWNANGFDSVGIYRSSNTTWYLTNNSEPSGITFSDIDFVYDIGSASPVVGDWDGDGDSTSGSLTSMGTFTLHPNNASSGSDNIFAFGPTGSKPISGKWVAGSQPPIIQNVISGASPGQFTNVGANNSGD